MKKLLTYLILLIFAAGCGETNNDKEQIGIEDKVELQVYSGTIVLDSSWSIKYKKKSNDGMLYFDDEKIISFGTNMPFIEEWKEDTSIILSDTINKQYLVWKVEYGRQFINLKSTEKEGDSYYYSFRGRINPEFENHEELIEFYYKLKELVLINDVEHEKLWQKVVLFNN
ncbi:MAG: hypothetical protein HRT73_11340 [Flavobacteriales bacterium]|nr:hypothetical protein [Flavobacteriales bacterium]